MSQLGDSEAAKKMKMEDTRSKEGDKKFDAQFKEWEEQFNSWKQKNANHPDKVMYNIF